MTTRLLSGFPADHGWRSCAPGTVEPGVATGESREAAEQLATADGHLAAGRWEEAIAALQGILDLPDPGLVEVAKGSGHLVRARDLANARLARMPAEGLRLVSGACGGAGSAAVGTWAGDAEWTVAAAGGRRGICYPGG